MKYLVNIPSWNGDTWHEYEGYDAEDAAMEAGKEYNEDGDYTLMNDSIFVLVKETENSEPVIVSVSAEPDIHYSACEVCNPIVCKQCKKDCKDMIIEGKNLYDDRYCSKNCYLDYLNEYRKEHNLPLHNRETK